MSIDYKLKLVLFRRYQEKYFNWFIHAQIILYEIFYISECTESTPGTAIQKMLDVRQMPTAMLLHLTKINLWNDETLKYDCGTFLVTKTININVSSVGSETLLR